MKSNLILSGTVRTLRLVQDPATVTGYAVEAPDRAPGSLSWEVCFDKFFKLSDVDRGFVRRAASILLVAEGATEVGSSDVNHRIFQTFRACGGDMERTFETILGEAMNTIPTASDRLV